MPSQPLHNSHSQTPTFFSFLSLFMVVASILLVLSGCSARNNDNASVVMAKPLTGKLTPLGTPNPSAERVTVGLYVINVYDINLSSQTYYLTGYVWMRWKGENDPTQSLEFTNTVEEWGLLRKNIYEKPLVLEDGSYYQATRIQGRFFQPFDLTNYPLDKQKLILLIENSDNADKVVFLPDTDASGYDQNLMAPGWDITSLQMEPLIHDYGTNFGDPADPGTYSTVKFALDLTRMQNLFIWKLMLPLVIVLFTNWLALLLSPTRIDVRTAMPATALLTTVFLQQASLDAIPQVASLVLMDKIYAVAYGVIVLTFARIIWDNTHINEQDAHAVRTMQRMDLISLVLQVTGFVLVTGFMVWSVL